MRAEIWLHEWANMDLHEQAYIWGKESRAISDRIFKIFVIIFSNTCNNMFYGIWFSTLLC